MKQSMGYAHYEEYRRSLVCTVCKEKAYRKHLCRACYRRDQQQRFHCTHRKCSSPVFAATLCQKHYRSWQTLCLYCSKNVHCRHLCRSHYRKALKNDEFPTPPPCKLCDKKTYVSQLCLHHFKQQYNKCIMVECTGTSHKSGLCCSHYFRERRADKKESI